jgi:hypothetical protein
MRGRKKMKQMKHLKRAMSLTLAATLIAGMFAMSAFADNENQEGSTGEEQTEASPSSGTAASKLHTTDYEKPLTELEVTKHVNYTHKNVVLPTQTFTVTMVPAGDDDLYTTTKDEGTGTETKEAIKVSGVPVEAGVALKTNSVTFEVGASTDTSDPTGVDIVQKFNLTQFADGTGFTKAGVYRYVVTETLPKDTEGKAVTNNGYIEYDPTKYIVDVFVRQNSSGAFVVTDIVLANEEATKPTSIKFTNKIDVQNLTISKKITTDTTEAKSGQLYEFEILIPIDGDSITLAATDKDNNGSYFQAYILDSKGNKVIDEGSGNDENKARTDSTGLVKLYVKGQNINADIDENGTKFYLKAGEKLEVAAPVSMIFSVKEKDYTSDGYTTTINYYEDGNLATTRAEGDTSTAVSFTMLSNYNITKDGKELESNVLPKGTVNTSGTDVVFTNKREIVADSGLYVDFIPYVLVMLIAVGGCVLFLSKKRRAR